MRISHLPLRQRESLGETAYATVRRWIADGAIVPGSSLREVELAEKLRISRTPVREALRRLQAEGLVQRDPRGGYTLFEFSPDDLAQVYEVREALEALAARLAAKKRSRAQLGQLGDALDAMDAAVTRGDDNELERLANVFHETIAEASGNWYLQEALASVRGILERRRPKSGPYTVRRKSMQAEHYELYDALGAQDADRAEALMRAHNTHALDLRLNDLQGTSEAKRPHMTARRKR